MQALVERITRQLLQTHSLKRQRRHRLQTEDPIDDDSDDVFDELPDWMTQPPQNASPEEKQEWVFRVQSIISHLQPRSSSPESTPSSYDADLAEPPTSKPQSKKRKRTKTRTSSKKSRNGRGRSSRSKSKAPPKLGPTSAPSRRKLMREFAVPKTPIKESVREEEPLELSTIKSPSFFREKNHENTSLCVIFCCGCKISELHWKILPSATK